MPGNGLGIVNPSQQVSPFQIFYVRRRRHETASLPMTERLDQPPRED
jgi:hypothetical protein